MNDKAERRTCDRCERTTTQVYDRGKGRWKCLDCENNL